LRKKPLESIGFALYQLENRYKRPWLAIVKFLLLAAFIAAVYLLGVSMVHHRFFRGGRIDPRGVLTQ
jgi:hypothetical protein